MKKVSKIGIIWLLWIALLPSLVKANDRDKLLKAHIDKTVKLLNQRLKHNQQLLLVKKNTDLDVIIDRYYVQVAKNTDKYLPVSSYLNDATKKQLNKILGKLRTLDFGYGNAYMYVLITSGPPLVKTQENLLKSREKHKKASEEYLKKIQAAITEQIKEESEKFANSVFFNSDLGKSSNNGILLNLYIQKVIYHERGQPSFHKYHHAYNVVGAQGKVSQIIKKQLRDIVVGTELRQMIKSSNSGSNLRYYASKLTTSLKRNHIVRCATYAIAEKFFTEFGYKVPKVDYSNIQSFESFFVSGNNTATSLLSYSKRDALVAERIYWKFRQFTTLFGARDKRFVSGFRFIQNPRFQWSKILSLDEKTPINPEKIFTAEELAFIKKHVNKTARQKSGTTLREVFPILYMINHQMWVITDRDSQTNPVPGTTSGKLADLFFTLRNHITGLQLSGTNIRSFDQQNLSGDVLYELMQTRYAYYQQLKGEGLMSFGKAILQVINIKNGFDLFVEVLTSVEIPKHWWNPLCKPKKGKECHDCKSGYVGGFGLTQTQQLNFAFVAGLYNGLIDQVKGAAQLASFVISYLSNVQLRQKINEAVANLKRSDVYKATKRYTDQYVNCGPHFTAYRSGRDVVNVLSLLLGFGELKAAAKSTEPFKTLVGLAKRNAKNYAKIAQYLPRMMVTLKNTGVKIISKTIDGVKVTLVYTSKAGQELLLTLKNHVIILAKQLDQNLTGGKLLGTFDQVVLKTPDGRTITTKVDIIQKNDRVYIQKSGSGGAGKALDWRGLLSADGLKKIEKWDFNTQKALYDDLKGDGEFRQIIQEKEALVEGWKVLYKADPNDAARLGKKGELEDVRKYLVDPINKGKSLDDVVKEIIDVRGYKKWASYLKTGFSDKVQKKINEIGLSSEQINQLTKDIRKDIRLKEKITENPHLLHGWKILHAEKVSDAARTNLADLYRVSFHKDEIKKAGGYAAWLKKARGSVSIFQLVKKAKFVTKTAKKAKVKKVISLQGNRVFLTDLKGNKIAEVIKEKDGFYSIDFKKWKIKENGEVIFRSKVTKNVDVIKDNLAKIGLDPLFFAQKWFLPLDKWYARVLKNKGGKVFLPKDVVSKKTKKLDNFQPTKAWIASNEGGNMGFTGVLDFNSGDIWLRVSIKGTGDGRRAVQVAQHNNIATKDIVSFSAGHLVVRDQLHHFKGYPEVDGFSRMYFGFHIEIPPGGNPSKQMLVGFRSTGLNKSYNFEPITNKFTQFKSQIGHDNILMPHFQEYVMKVLQKNFPDYTITKKPNRF